MINMYTAQNITKDFFIDDRVTHPHFNLFSHDKNTEFSINLAKCLEKIKVSDSTSFCVFLNNILFIKLNENNRNKWTRI